jgi:multidrug efflux pump subunit AcrA (membrane-fusion protein)
LGFEANGKITRINKNIGDSVSPGDVLAEIDSSSLRTDLAKAQNALQQAQLQYQKNMNPLSDTELQQLASEFELSKMSYEQQITKLDNDTIGYEQSIATAKQKLLQIQQDIDTLSGDNSLALKTQVEDQNFLQKQKELYTTFFDITTKLREFDEKVDQFMGFSTVNALANDSYENNIAALNSSYKNTAQSQWQSLHAVLQSFKNPSYVDYETLKQDAPRIQELLATAKLLAVTMQDVMGASVAGNSLTQTQIDSWKSTFL